MAKNICGRKKAKNVTKNLEDIDNKLDKTEEGIEKMKTIKKFKNGK